MDHRIYLRAVVNGDNNSDAFQLVAEAGATVADLRPAINRYFNEDVRFCSHALCDVTMERLELWRVVVPLPVSFGNNEINFEDEVNFLDNQAIKRKLGPVEKVAFIFGGPGNTAVEEEVYLLVKFT
ncbi:hypothetical protein BGW39_010282 [Mortierella sp. 14UC]|nr:hypothetical protein BGW39_010282 [Mortierella sp. 14UC]